MRASIFAAMAILWTRAAFAQPTPEPPAPPAEPTAEEAPPDPVPVAAPDPPPEPGAPTPSVAPAATAPAIVAPPPAVADRYPRALVLRELFLPAGAFEGTVLFEYERIGNDSPISLGTVEPRIRYNLGVVEASAGVELQLLADAPEFGPVVSQDETFQAVSVGARYRAATDLGVGAELTLGTPADSIRWAPRVVLARKLRLTPRSAIELTLAPGFDHATVGSESMSSGLTTLAIGGEVSAQAQVAPAVALVGRAALRYFDPLGEAEGFSRSAYLAQDYGIRLVAGVTAELDVVAGYDVLYTGELAWKAFTIGVSARRVP